MNRPRASTWWVAVPLGLVLLAGLLLLLVDLFDRRLIADPLASLIEERTDRALRMADFDLRWGWPLALRAENVTFANADWGSDVPLLQAPVVSVSINPFELLDGPPYADLHLQDPRVLVERSTQGEWNWLIDTGPAEPEEAPRLPVTISAGGGKIVYEEPASLAIELQRFLLAPGDGAEGAGELALTLRAVHDEMPLSAHGRIAVEEESWEGRITLGAGESSLTGRFRVDTGAEPLRVQADIHSSLLVPARLVELRPARDDSGATDQVSLPRLDGVDADVEVAVAALRLQALEIEDLEIQASVKNGHLRLTELMARVGQARVESSAAVDTTAPEPTLHVAAELARVPLVSLPQSLPLSAQPGEIAARFNASLVMPGRQLPLTPAGLLSRLAVPESRFLYATERGEGQAALIAHLEVAAAGGEPSLNVALEGVEAPPVSATLSAPPLARLADGTAYPVQLALNTEGVQVRINAQLGELLRERTIDLTFSASGSQLPALPALGFTPPPVPEFSLAGALRQADGRWAAQGLAFSYGATELSGSAVYDPGGERPSLALDVQGPLLDLTAIPRDLAGEPSEDAGERARSWIPDGLADALHAFDADVELSVERLRITDEYSLADVHVAALLDRGALQVEPVAFEVAGGSVRGSLLADSLRSPVDGQLSLHLQDLEPGRISDSLAPLDEHLGRMSGELQLQVAELRSARQPNEILLPALGRLSLVNTRLQFQQADANTNMTLRFPTGGLTAPEEEEQELVIRAAGQYRGEPVQLALRGGPLLSLRNPQSPYELQTQLQLAGVKARLEGRVLRPWAPRSARFEFSGSAGDPRPLQALLQPFVSVSLPAFDVDGVLDYEPGRVSLQDFAARFADSDLRGNLSLDLSAQAPAVTADLHSNELNVGDVTGLLNGDDNGETDTVPVPGAAGNVLPQQRFDFAFLRRAYADIEYSADDVDAGGIPLGAVTARVHLEDGRILAERIHFEPANGNSTLRVDVQSRRSLLEGVVDIEARGLNLSEMLDGLDIASDSFGIVGAQGKFWLSGDSIASVLGSADGGLMLLMTGGQLDSLLVEVAGLDIGEAALAASGLYDAPSIDCAYASLHGTDGIVLIDQFVIDTSDTTFFLNGEVDLGEETLDLALFPEAKDPSFPTADSPLAFTGSLLQPEVELLTGELAARALGAGALAALAGPVAAALPFIELGVQDEPDECKGWVEKLRSERHNDS